MVLFGYTRCYLETSLRCNKFCNGLIGAQLLLFFLAFVFGSFCTFCFHVLMYMFDEKCVLFPKLLTLTTLKHNNIYEFIPSTKELTDLPVDFVSAQWADKSTCALPTYVPLVSGTFGLVWITMFLMCSTESRTLTGLQRPWRVLPPVFMFSLAMSSLCIYSSVITHSGLQELCLQLGEITGSSTCTYTVNVVTLMYERRIRGVYQATRLTILCAWLHTTCWVLSTLLVLVRVLLAIDFRLVRVNVDLHGDINKILEQYEVQIRTVSPETWINVESESDSIININSRENKDLNDRGVFTDLIERRDDDLVEQKDELFFLEKLKMDSSELSGTNILDERNRKTRVKAIKHVPEDKAFIVKWLYDLVDKLHLSEFSDGELVERTTLYTLFEGDSQPITRQFGQAQILSQFDNMDQSREEKLKSTVEPEFRRPLTKVDSLLIHQDRMRKTSIHFKEETSPRASTSRPPHDEDSVMNITLELQHILEHEQEKKKKSNFKTIGVQVDKGKKGKRGSHVQISEKTVVRMRSDDEQTTTSAVKKDVDKETQTGKKEKQD